MLMPMMSGPLHNIGRTMRLQMQWQKRREDPTTPKGREESPQMKNLREQARSAREGSVLAGLDNKLKSGKRLTEEEKNYLRLNAPQLYQQAVEAEAERESYKRALERCHTKEEVERLNTQKMQSLASEIGRIASNPRIPEGTKLALAEQINRRSMGIQAEQNDFVSSGKLAALPTEQEERDRIEAERDELAGRPPEEPAEDEPATDEPPVEPPTAGEETPPETPTDQAPTENRPDPPNETSDMETAKKENRPKAKASLQPDTSQGPTRPITFLDLSARQHGKARLARRA